jgi:hypothetical protein
MKTTFLTTIITLLIFSSVAFFSCKKTSKYGAGNGKAMFWTRIATGGPISVTLNGETKIIEYYYFDVPTGCELEDMVSWVLPAGTYNFSATDGASGNWSSSITITEGECNDIEFLDGSSTGGGGGGGGGGTTACSDLIKGYGSVATQTSTGVYGNWGNWHKVADVGNGAVYISFKLTYCFLLSGDLAVAGYPKWRIQNTCTNGGNCKLDFAFEYTDCDGVAHTQNEYNIDLDHAYTDEDPGMWFFGKNISKSYVASSIKID